MTDSTVTEAMIEAALQAQCDAPGCRWSDGVTDGVAVIMRAKMEKALSVALTMQAARNPVTDEEVERVARAICEAGTEEPGLCFRDDDPHKANCIRSCVPPKDEQDR